MKRKRKQPDPDLFSLKCVECGEYLIQTESGYLCCPKGHGRLRIDAEADIPGENSGSWFDTLEIVG
jgi:hypothetical protein